MNKDWLPENTGKNLGWAFLGFLAICLMAIAAPFVGIYKLVIYLRQRPEAQYARALKKATQLHARAEALNTRRTFPAEDEFRKEIIGRLMARRKETYLPSYPILTALMNVADDLYLAEAFGRRFPPPDKSFSDIELARYTDSLTSYVEKVSNENVLTIMEDTLLAAFIAFTEKLPPQAAHSLDDIKAVAAGTLKPGLTIPLIDIVEPGVLIEELVLPLFAAAPAKAKLFEAVREQLERNQHIVSGIPFDHDNRHSAKLIMPRDLDAAPKEAVRDYLRETPFEQVFEADPPFQLLDGSRFEHHWICAGTGHGKTQTLQFLIANDLPRVARGEASVIVIDSQGDLIRNIAGLSFFAENPDRLVLIDPTDIEWPVALNLFAMGTERLTAYSALDREKLLNSAIELYDYILSALLGAEMTARQGTLFRFAVQLMLIVPDATIHTFRRLMQPGGSKEFAPYIDKLQGTAREFFRTQFDAKIFEQTKQQVVARLFTICENRTFERLFSHPKTKLDLFAELNGGKVILINTAKELLKQTGAEVFGRFFIAMIAQAAQERTTIPEAKRLPTFVYIDETQDYVDEKIGTILEQARKFKIGMVLAHQYIGQLSARLQDSFAANTSIKFAGGVSADDARKFARMLRCEPSFIEGQGKGHFAAFVRNYTQRAVSLRIPFGFMEELPKAPAAEQEAQRAEMRSRYAVHVSELADSAKAEDEEQPARQTGKGQGEPRKTPEADVRNPQQW